MLHHSVVNITALQHKPRNIIGLMSGTSLDGLDIALCQISGQDTSTAVQIKAFLSIPYTNEFIQKVRTVFANPLAPLAQVTNINAWIARQHAAMVLQTLSTWNILPEQIDILASHGQTIFHAPNTLDTTAFNHKASTTLQVGDGCHLAYLTQILTLSDFRQKHVAAGGEGAPLVPYADFLLFAHEQENRILLNIGGIANYTFLPANKGFSSIVSADTGPGNTLIDTAIAHAKELQLANRLPATFPLISCRYDENGCFAEKGHIDPLLLSSLEKNAQGVANTKVGKSTGQETYNLAFINSAMTQSKSSLLNTFPTTEQGFYDLIATLTMFTALSISVAISKLPITMDKTHNTVIYVSGGGVHNATLMKNIQACMPTLLIKTSDSLGMLPDAKEAALFAVLANQTLFGSRDIFANNQDMPDVCFGKISLP